jgi:glycosyltransferase involved in cell wall biosynthesis
MRSRRPQVKPNSTATLTADVVVCSLEAWDDVWRRNQFFAEALLRRNPLMRILFVEPPADPLFAITHRRLAPQPRLAALRGDRRLWALRPLKPLPRRLGPGTDRWLCKRVVDASARVGFTRPLLWLNDVTYAPLITRPGWPTLYDVTDDWLLAPASAREITRLQRLDAIALEGAQEVVVCSPALAASRGANRSVTLVPNGVDAAHLRRPRSRPADLPPGRTAVYVGTLHESRLDVALVAELARALSEISVVLVGPDCLSAPAHRDLLGRPNVHILGSRPYADVPAYFQHADVLIVPHLTPFTESLDPIKARECAVVDTQVVATAAAGFRELADLLCVVPRDGFVVAVASCLASGCARSSKPPAMSWEQRAAEFESVLWRLVGGTRVGDGF